MKLQMRTVREQFESLIACFPDRFQQIYRHRLLTMNLGRDSEVHKGIVKGGIATKGTKGTSKRTSVFCAFCGYSPAFFRISAAAGYSFLALAKKIPWAISSGVQPSLVLASTRAPWSIRNFTIPG